MEKFEKLENDLYASTHGIPIKGNYKEIWAGIKSDLSVLNEAVQIERNKFDNGDIVKGLNICNFMLRDYKSVDSSSYDKLINSIYTNTAIARIVLEGYSNGGDSFLLMSLWNHNLKLSSEQKAYAVNEAMNKTGTVRSEKKNKEFSKELEKQNITDDIVTTLDIDGCSNLIGAKTKNEYISNLFTSLGCSQAHGRGEFDIRYCILRNPNWNLEEKQKLIMDFWYDDETYDECLEQWEWAIVNDRANYKGESLPMFDKSEMYEYSYNRLLEFYGNKQVTDEIWEDIQFCKQMHLLRPQQWEIENITEEKTLVITNVKNY